MAMTTVTQSIVSAMQQQRDALGMSYEVLAKRAGLGVRTVSRVLHGDVGRLENAVAIAGALGMKIGVLIKARPSSLRRQQARRQARRLTGIAQGNAALEGQAVSKDTLRDVEHRLAEKLLGGAARRLWGD